ncbi:transcriptional regulator, AraC family [Caldimonas brevitalea]|uniref:Transcriptional regulator, AraC family n=2 Tax=Caldimonas brevitalea TaxID=413882 RepID=A0A0G3BR16_9BURK|nr:transcriptional regulator, AraC family [Caldimonas brevitalea]
MPSGEEHLGASAPHCAKFYAARVAQPHAVIDAAAPRDHLYRLGAHGFIFTSAGFCSTHTQRHAATLLISATGRSFELRVGTRRIHAAAAFVPPLTARSLHAVDAALVSVNVTPLHDSFAHLACIPAPSALDWGAFAPLQPSLQAAYEGRLELRDAPALFASTLQCLWAHLPVPSPRITEHLLRARELVHTRGYASLREMACEMHLSEDQTSRVVARALGIPLKSYLAWDKMLAACEWIWRHKPLTEVAHLAGYHDLAHLTRSFRRQFGAPPSYFRDRTRVYF